MKKITLVFALLLACWSWQTKAQVTIGSGTLESENAPFEPYYGYSYTQSVYLASEVNASGTITGLQWYYSGTSALTNAQELVIYMAESSRSSFSDDADWEPITSFTEVYSGGITVTAGTAGWVQITFDTPFVYSGAENLIIAVEDNMSGYNSSGDDFHNSEVLTNRTISSYGDGATDNVDPNAPIDADNIDNTIPNVMLMGITQTCPNVSNLVVSNITETSADIAWTAGGSETMWNIEVVPGGGAPTGTATFSGVTNPFTVTDLNNSTYYDVYVQADCGSGDLSAMVGPISFTTVCGIVDAYPSYTNFTNNPPTICWTEAGSGEIIDGPAEDEVSDWRDGTSYMNEMEEMVNSNAINLYSTGDREWLISPEYSIATGGPYRLVVEVAVTDYNDLESDVMGEDDEVKLLMTNDAGTTITEITTWDFNNQPSVNGTEFIFDLDTYTGVVQFALWASDGTVNDDPDYDFHVGVFTVEEIPSCLEPTDLVVSNVTTTTADLSWTAGGGETVWEILYGFEDFDFDTEGTIVTDIDGTLGETITGLNPENDYEFFVRADCGAGDFSTWAGPFEFSTAVAPVIVTLDAPILDQAYCYESNDMKEWLFQSDDGSPISIEFFAGNLEVDVDGLTFDDLIIYDGTDATGTVLFNSDVDGNELTEVFLIGTSGSIFMTLLSDPYVSCEEGDQVAMDFDVEIYIAPTCLAPIDVMASSAGSMDSVYLTWTETGDATEWEIVYGEAGFDIATEGITVTDNDGTLGITINSLTIDTAYEFYVRAICAADDLSEWEDVEFFTGYCTSEPSSLDGTGIENVEIGLTNFPSGGALTYENFSDTAVDLPQGILTNVEVTFDHSFTYYTNIWIDFNDDLVFDATELVFAGESNDLDPNVVDASFLMPLDAPLGTHGMRIGTADAGQSTPDPCYNGSWGVTADFTVNITEAPSCLAPTNISIVELGFDTVTISWDAFVDAVEYDYVLVYDGLSPDSPLQFGTTTGTEITIPTLAADTSYEVYVKSSCADSDSAWTSISFYTGYCISEPSSVDGTGLENVEIGVTNFPSGGDLVYENFTATPVDLPQGILSSVEVTFDHSFTYYTNIWIDFNDDLVFDATELVFAGESNNLDPNVVDASFIMPLDAPLGTHGMRIGAADSGQSTPDPCYNGSWGVTADFTVNITVAPDCVAPVNIVISDIVSDSAMVTWDALPNAATYNYIVIFAGLDPNTATPLFSGSTTDTFVQITGLSATTDYEVYLTTDCGTETSAFSAGIEFTTPCATYTPNFYEEFDTFLPVCWSEAGSGTPTEGPSDLDESIWAHDEFVNDSDMNDAIKINLYTTGRQEWVISPLIDLSGGDYVAVFEAGLTDFANSNMPEGNGMGVDDQVQLLITTDGGVTWETLLTYDASNYPSVTGQNEIVDLTAYTGNAQFAFWATDGTINDSEDYDFFVNFFWVVSADDPLCFEPENVVVSGISSDSATLTWDVNANAVNGYEYVVMLPGVTPDPATAVLTGTTIDLSVLLSPLDPATNYDVYVRANCGGVEMGPWSSVVSFITQCIAVTEFSENFDAVSTPIIPICWGSVLDNGVSDFATVETVTNEYFSAPNSVEMYNSSSDVASNIMLVAPMVSNLDAGTHWLRFYAMNSNDTQEVEVGTLADPNDGSTFTPLTLIDINGDWEEYTVDFTAYTGTDDFIAIRRLNSSTFTNVYIDNAIWEPVPSCIYPSDVVVTATAIDGATITWGASTGSIGYSWVVVAQGGDPDVAAEIVQSGTTTTPDATITGLLSGTVYDFYVMTDCGAANGMSTWSTLETFTTAYGCGDTFYDTGGATGDYSDNEEQTWTFYPNDPTEYVQVSFTMVDVESCCEDLMVFDGVDITAPLLDGDIENPGVYTSSTPGGALTVTFSSDGSVSNPGWEAAIECVTCIAPVNIQIVELFEDGAEVTWDALADAIDGYEWVVVAAGGDPSTPLASGTTDTNSVIIDGLESGTDYEVYLLSNCGDVNGLSTYSEGVPFTTACQAPTGLSVETVGFDQVLFSWDPVPGSLGYEYIIVVNGAELIEENYVAIGTIGSAEQSELLVEYLDMGIEYDLYLRIVCDTAYYGEWGMVTFETMGVESNIIEGFSYYPNPVKDSGLNLEASQNIDAVVVYNMLGQEILNLKPQAKHFNVEMSNLQAGAYILKVTVGGTTGTYRIIKE